MSPPTPLRLTLFAVAGALALGCAKPPLTVDVSQGLDIAVDGEYGDWQGRFTRIDPKRSVGLGITRDDTNLYLCLVTRDFGVQALMRRAGFTLWIDPAGGQRKRLGLRVAPLATSREPDEDGPPERGAAVAPRIEIVREGAEYGYQLADVGGDGPVGASTAQKSDVVVYEFRLALDTALSTSDPGSRVPRDRVLGVGLVTEPLEVPDLPRGAPRPPDIEPLRSWVIARPTSGAEA